MGTQFLSVSAGVPVLSSLGASPWFAVQTRSRHEKQVALQLAGRGIEHLLPLYDEIHRWGDRRVSVQLPLFPGYLFVSIAPQRRMDVLRIAGVAKMVGFNGSPAPVPFEEIHALRCGLISGTKIEPHPFLKSGCRVRVRSGALQGLEGILVRWKDKARIVLSVDLIMKSVALETDAADLEVIS